MKGLIARVHNGRLVLDVPTSLPEGTEIELVMYDGGDDLDDEDRAALHAALVASWQESESGDIHEIGGLLNELKRP